MSEYRYITQEVIRAGVYRPENAEAAAEAERYNSVMREGFLRKGDWARAVDFYKLLNIVTLIVELTLLPRELIYSLLDTKMDKAEFMSSSFVGILLMALGFMLILARYAERSPFSFKWVYANDPENQFTVTAGNTYSTVKDKVLWFGLEAAVILGCFFLPFTFTVSFVVSCASWAVHAAVFFIYVRYPERYRVPVSVIFALIPVIMTPAAAVWSAMMTGAAIVINKRRRIFEVMEGAPDFPMITVKFRKVASFEELARPDNNNNEMESL